MKTVVLLVGLVLGGGEGTGLLGGLADAGGDGDGDLAACEEHGRWAGYDRSIMVGARARFWM